MDTMSSNGKLTLEERKHVMVDMLAYFLKYCEEKDLRCFISSGTLLGAFRHEGFIPWDDDVDVSMPIDDYNRLIKLTRNGTISSFYSISTPQNNPNHMWPMLKVIDTRTVMIEPMMTRKLKKAQNEFYGIYLDVFPAYGLPNKQEERMLFQMKIFKLYSSFMKSSRIMNRRPKDNTLFFGIRYILYWLYTYREKCIGWKYYLKQIEEMINAYPLHGASYFSYAVGMLSGMKGVFRTDLLRETCSLKFETINVPVLSGIDEMLTNMYGNYMELPPVEERSGHVVDVRWK